MSDVKTKVQVQKTTPREEQKLREVQVKKFSQNAFMPIGQNHDILTAMVPDDWTFSDVLNPMAWTNVCRIVSKDPSGSRRDKTGSRIFVESKNFSADLRISGITQDQFGQPNGLIVTCIGPQINPVTGQSCPVNITTGMAWVDSPAKEG